MDTEAYLRKHGWQGAGHSLHPSKAHAIKKPLLVSKKIDVLGLGQNKHSTVSDQWWLRAFDSSLKDFGSGKKSLLSSVKDHGIKQGGLYGHFVAGGGFAGTIQPSSAPLDTETTVRMSTKRKADDEGAQPTGSNKKSKPSTGEMAHVHADRQISVAQNTHGSAPEQQQLSTKKVSVKAEKYAREKAKREAKRASRAQLGGSGANSIAVGGERVRKATVKGTDASKKDITKARASEKARKKQAKQEKILAKREAKKRKAAFTVEKRARRRSAMAEKFAAKAREGSDAPEATNGTSVAAADSFASGADIIKLGNTATKPQGRPKSAPVDALDRKRAEEFGMTVEAYQALPITNYKKQKTLFAQLRELDPAKKARYAERAAEKGQSLEHYFLHRVAKNLAAAGVNHDADTVEERTDSGFAIDTEGDAKLAAGEPNPHSVHALAKMPAEEALRVIDPETWAGKVVKQLPKDVRETRRIWMAAKRAVKHNKRVAEGRATRRKGDGGQTRHEMKEKRLQGLMLDVLRHSRRAVFGAPGQALSNDARGDAPKPEPEPDMPSGDKLFDRVKKGHKDKNSVGMRGEEDMYGNPLPPLKPVSDAKMGPDGLPLPVVNISTRTGLFTEGEIKAARRAARRIIRHEKQANKRGPNSTKKIGKKRGRK